MLSNVKVPWGMLLNFQTEIEATVPPHIHVQNIPAKSESDGYRQKGRVSPAQERVVQHDRILYVPWPPSFMKKALSAAKSPAN